MSQMNDSEKQKQLTLGLLQAIEQRDDISQRHLAQEMGIALGLANSYLKRCVKKGWIKISTAPANRYLYYVTPTGFAEKAKLTAEFLSTSLTLFREAGDAYTQLFQKCLEQDHTQVSLLGVSDLTEIAYLRSLDAKVSVMSIYDPNSTRENLFGIPITASVETIKDVVVVTAMNQAIELIDEIQQSNPDVLVLVPEFLRNLNVNVESPSITYSAASQVTVSNNTYEPS
jgi:DNA-binding MarR family transcriptional regulator